MGVLENSAYEVNSGLKINNGPLFIGGTASPIGLDEPLFSVYVQELSNGIIFWKHNSSDPNDWAPITAEIFSASPPSMVVIHNGNISGNQLIGYSNVTNNPIIVGFRSRLNRVTTNNANSSADFSIDFFRNQTDQGDNNGFHRHTVVDNTPNLSIVSGGPIFEEGDIIYLYYRDEGTNANDLSVGLFFEAQP